MVSNASIPFFAWLNGAPFIRHRVRKSLPGEAGTEVFPSTSLNSWPRWKKYFTPHGTPKKSPGWSVQLILTHIYLKKTSVEKTSNYPLVI